ncbi:hypothetical protein RvY_01084 [Ramazzottius varieornatus]|uniref:Troponin T n=1 Tax=Ramazzottius varieornatus TaxID=947166 RepID=A0A1D1UJ17_RAMVA|nr:hypothetical protein RvY_01084 [Ramazzottius varieornatus]
MEALRLMEEQRRLAREKEDEDLRRLKEKQAQRKREREEEERRMAEEKALLEEQRRKEEEARKQKIEDEKRKKQEEAERKKAAAAAAMSGGRNFVIEKEKEGQGESTIDKFMNISKAKTEMSLNTIELETLRQKTISDRVKPLSIADLDVAGLKATAEELWKTIVQLETSKYDLAERFKRQEYDLKELNERQRQINNKKHVASGAADPNAAASRYPPKVVLISKYERRTDRRTFGERKSLFEKDGKVEEQKELIKPKAIKAKADWVKNKDDVKKVRHDDDEETEKDPEGRDHDEVENVRPRKMSNAKEQEELPQKNQIEQETDETAADEPAAAAEEEGESLW